MAAARMGADVAEFSFAADLSLHLFRGQVPVIPATGERALHFTPNQHIPANPDSSHFLVTSYTSNRSDWLNSEWVNIFDGEIYRLALEQTPKLDKVIP